MKYIILAALMLATVVSTSLTSHSFAAGQEKQILQATKDNWVSFRDYNGRQLIYFTHLEAWKCGITEVRFSINSDALDQIYELQACGETPDNAVTVHNPYIVLHLNTAQSISVQITYEDGSKSEVVHKRP